MDELYAYKQVSEIKFCHIYMSPISHMKNILDSTTLGSTKIFLQLYKI